MAITETQLSNIIAEAFNAESEQEVNPQEARKRIADKLAAGMAQYVVGRQTTVTGTSASGGSVTGTGIINE